MTTPPCGFPQGDFLLLSHWHSDKHKGVWVEKVVQVTYNKINKRQMHLLFREKLVIKKGMGKIL